MKVSIIRLVKIRSLEAYLCIHWQRKIIEKSMTEAILQVLLAEAVACI